MKREFRIAKKLAREPIERRRPSRNSSGDEHATWTQHSRGFAERGQSILSSNQVIQWPQHQHHRRRSIVFRQGPRISDRARRESSGCRFVPRLRDRDQARHGVDQSDIVSETGKPECIRTGATADIHHRRRRLRRVAKNELAGPKFLELRRAALKTRFLGCAIVVRFDCRIDHDWLRIPSRVASPLCRV